MCEFGDSIEELERKLTLYGEQLESVSDALKLQPDEPNLKKLFCDLQEVIRLTEDLLDHKANAGGGPKSAVDSLIGRTCEAPYAGERYLGSIIEISTDPNTGEKTVAVEFYGWHNREDYKLSDIRINQPPHPSFLKPKTKAQAVLSSIGEWVDCIIAERLSNGSYVVEFPSQGNLKLQVNFDQVRLNRTATTASSVATNNPGNRRVKEVITPAGYRIPEYLTIKQTDSEATKHNKKRKVQLLKKQQKQEQVEEEAKQRATCWRQFAKKSLKKKSNSFLTSHNRESIFKSSGDVKPVVNQNAIIVTTNTGFVPRRKYDFEEKPGNESD